MGLLKKIKSIVFQKKLKASTLIETLVATVIIVVIFAIASLTLNAVFKNSVKNNTQEITSELNFLEYQYQNKQLGIPYYGNFKDWEINIEKNSNYINFAATNKLTKKTVTKQILNATE